MIYLPIFIWLFLYSLSTFNFQIGIITILIKFPVCLIFRCPKDQTYVEHMQDENTYRFSIQAFTFKDGQDSIYVHCKSYVCQNTSNELCNFGCNKNDNSDDRSDSMSNSNGRFGNNNMNGNDRFGNNNNNGNDRFGNNNMNSNDRFGNNNNNGNGRFGNNNMNGNDRFGNNNRNYPNNFLLRRSRRSVESNTIGQVHGFMTSTLEIKVTTTGKQNKKSSVL